MSAQKDSADMMEIEKLVADLRIVEKKGLNFLNETAKKLTNIGQNAVEPLIIGLKDKNRFVRIGSALALGDIGDIRAVEPLITALEDEDRQVRTYSAEALEKFGDARAFDALMSLLRNKYEHPETRATAIDALGSIGDSRAKGALQAALHDKDAFVRWAAEAALKKIDKTTS